MNVQSPVLVLEVNEGRIGSGMEMVLVLSRKCDPCSDPDPNADADGAGNDCGMPISVLRVVKGILMRC